MRERTRPGNVFKDDILKEGPQDGSLFNTSPSFAATEWQDGPGGVVFVACCITTVWDVDSVGRLAGGLTSLSPSPCFPEADWLRDSPRFVGKTDDFSCKLIFQKSIFGL
jgi:hypothetical protein